MLGGVSGFAPGHSMGESEAMRPVRFLATFLVATLPLITWTATFGLALSQGGAHVDFLVAIAIGATVLPAYAFARRRWGGPKNATIAA